MNKEFVPYDIALAMKELGFDEDVCGFHSKDKGLLIVSPEYNDVIKLLKAPLYQQAFRWFREKYNLYGKIERELERKENNEGRKVFVENGFWMYCIMKIGEKIPKSLGFDLKDKATYEEAQEACLKKLIEIVKANKDVDKNS